MPYRRMSTVPHSIQKLPTPLISTIPRGPAVTGLGDLDGPEMIRKFWGHFRWRFLRKHDDDYSTVEDYPRVKPGSVQMMTESQIDQALSAAGALAAEYEARVDSAPDESASSEATRVFRGEVEHLRKTTVNKGYHEGYWRQNIVSDSGVVPEWYKRRMRANLRLYLHPEDAQVTSSPLPAVIFDTSAGWPTFMTGIGAKVLGCSFYEPGVPLATLRERAMDWAAKHGLDDVSTFGNGYGTRTGPNAKPTLLYKPRGDSFVAEEQWQSGFCRRRQIFMAPMPGFLALRKMTRWMKASRRYNIRGNWHAGDTDTVLATLAAGFPGITIEGDISGYDTNIWRALQLEFREATVELFGAHSDPARWVDDYVFLDGIGTIYPSNQASGVDSRAAAYLTRTGGLSSGILPTAEVGNVYHAPIVDEVLFRCGYKDPIAARQRGHVVMLMASDDLLLHAENLRPDVAAEVYAEVGLTVKTLQANRFLMQHRFGPNSYPVGGRIVQQSFFNEHEPTDRFALPLMVLGLAARWGRGPHPLVAEDIREILSLGSLNKIEGVFDGPSALRWLGTARGTRLLTAAFASRNAQAWYARHERDAEYSTASRTLINLAKQMGFVASVGQAQLGQVAVNKLLGSSKTKIAAVREALWAAYHNNATETQLDNLALTELGVDKSALEFSTDDALEGDDHANVSDI